MRKFNNHPPLRRGGGNYPLALSLRKALVLACTLIGGAAAQTAPNSVPVTALNPVMGFETHTGWTAQATGGVSPVMSLSPTRTQGKFALALADTASVVTLTSQPVPLNATALTGIASADSSFEVDVMLPVQQGAVNHGSLELFVNSVARRLSNARVGEVDFSQLRSGIYSTLTFPIPPAIRSALGPSPIVIPGDVSFQFKLHEPGNGGGTYLFDNLRVYFPPAVTDGPNVHPPAGYGGSVDLVATNTAPGTQAFEAGPVQVPDSFHLNQGTTTPGSAGTSAVRLDLGYEGASSFQCTYGPDLSDATRKSYRLSFCTGGIQAGDLIGASWASLAIQSEDATARIQAQLARNPVGEKVGAGTIPPMPTFWGDIDGCVPAPVRGKVVTTTPGCTVETNQASQIATDYFNRLDKSGADAGWVVAPTPDFARRHGGKPLQSQPSIQGNVPLFNAGDHLCGGCKFDGYWQTYGGLSTNTTPDNHHTTHFDATFGGHVVIWGWDIDVASVNSTANSDSGPPNGTGSSAGSVHSYLFGAEVPDASFDLTSDNHFSTQPVHEDLDFATVHIWIFKITLGATASVGIDASGTLSPAGFNLRIVPNVSLGMHLSGGVDIIIASGEVDARVELINAALPVNASASWDINTTPSRCSALLNFNLGVDVVISSGGGEVDLVVKIGVCPFCKHKSWRLFGWDPLVSADVFSMSASSNQEIPLPAGLCIAPLTVTITPPPPPVNSGLTYVLRATAFSPNNYNLAVPCTGFTWTSSDPGDLFTRPDGTPDNNGCGISVTFGSTPGSRILTLNVKYDVTHIQTIEETGSDWKSVSVTPLSTGTHIIGIDGFDVVPQTWTNPPGPAYAPYDGQTLRIDYYFKGETVNFTGAVVGGNGNVKNVWAVDDGKTGQKQFGTGLKATWTIPNSGEYMFILSTWDSAGQNLLGFSLIDLHIYDVPR